MSDTEKKKISTKKLVIYIVLIVIIGITIPFNLMRKSEATQAPQTNPPAPAAETPAAH